MEYAESREYAHGDDARHIDWRLTARSGKPHTKLFQAERERLTLLVADTAPALYFGTRVRFTSEIGRESCRDRGCNWCRSRSAPVRAKKKNRVKTTDSTIE